MTDPKKPVPEWDLEDWPDSIFDEVEDQIAELDIPYTGDDE